MLKSLFSIAASLLKIGKDAPPPVHLFFMPPVPQLMPPGTVKKAYANDVYELSITGIENFSSRVLTNIRIKLTAYPEYPPAVMNSGMRRLTEFSFDSERNEIRIDSLDPEEKVYFGLFYKAENSPAITEPTVIIEGRKISRAMQLLGYARRYPLPALVNLFCFLAVSVAVAGVVLAVFRPEYISPNKVLLDKVAKDFGTCQFVVLNKEEVSSRRLAGSKIGLNLLLEVNEVSSMKELLIKDKIVSCE